MSIFSKAPAAFLVLLIACFSSVTAAQSPLDQIARLNAAGQAQAAYELSVQLLPQYEGEPAFDLHYAVAAIDYGKISEGAFALERVLMNQPNNDYARLELGRAYFALEEDGRAKDEFNRVLAANPPEQVVGNVENYLRAIESRRYKRESTFTANFNIRSGYDSNVNAASDQDNLGGGLSLVNTGESSSFVHYKVDATYTRPIVYGTNGFLSGYVGKNDNLNPDITNAADEDIDLDIFSYGAKVGFNRDQEANNWRLVLQADVLDLDSEEFRDSLGLTGSWARSLDRQRAVTVFGLISKNSFAPERSFRDSTLGLVGLSYRQRFASAFSPLLSLSLNIGKDNADDDQASGALENTQRDILGLNAGLSFTLRDDLRLDSGVSIQKSDYQNPQAIPSTTGLTTELAVREDARYSLNIGLSWFARDNLLFKLDSALVKTDSSISIWEHDRNQIAASVRYTYK